MVFEARAGARMPVEGVEVYCDACGPFGHTASFTDANGNYELPGAPAGVTRVLVAKAGFKLVAPVWVNSVNPTAFRGLAASMLV